MGLVAEQRVLLHSLLVAEQSSAAALAIGYRAECATALTHDGKLEHIVARWLGAHVPHRLRLWSSSMAPSARTWLPAEHLASHTSLSEHTSANFSPTF